MHLELLIIYLVIIAAPFIFVRFFVKTTSKSYGYFACFCYVILMFVVSLPVIKFLFTINSIEKVFPDDCATASKLSRGFIGELKSSYTEYLNEYVVGIRPEVYFLSTIAICEYRRGDLVESERVLIELLNLPHIDSSRHFDASKYEALLMQIRSKRGASSKKQIKEAELPK